MGDQRRDDTDRAHRDEADELKTKRTTDADREHEDGFDTKHAKKQMKMRGQARGDYHPDLPERAFEGSGADQDQLWDRFEALLANNVVSDEVLEVVRDMDGPHRGMVRARLADIAKVTTGGDLLVIAEFTSALPGAAVDAALTCPTKPTAGQLRAYLSRIDPAAIKIQLGDAATVAKLRATYASPIAILPRLPELLDNVPLASWYLNDTPHEQIAMAMIRSERPQHTAELLEKVGRGGWMWAFHVTDAMTAINHDAVATYAKKTSQADVGAFLQDRFDAYGKVGADVGQMSKATDEVDSELKKRAPDIDAVVDDLGVAVGLAEDELRKHKPRMLAAATARQIDQATQLAAFKPAERLAWLVEGKRVTPDALRDVVSAWPTEDLENALDDKHVGTIRKRWPASSPADVLGRVPETLYGSLAKSTVVRTWIVKTGEPNDILHLLAFWPGRTAEMARWVEAHAGWDWLDRVGGGLADHELRVLALHCPNKAISERIQKYMLGDAIDETSEQVKPQPIARTANEDPNDRFNRELRYKRGRELSDAAGELRPEDVIELRADTERLKRMLANTKFASLVRVLYLVEPPLRLVLTRDGSFDEVDAQNLTGWVRTRPGTDVADALADPTAAANAMKLWPIAPLEIFPQLRQAAVLSRVLDANSDVLRWIVEHSEPMSALHAIGASGVVKATVSALEEDDGVLDLLPSGQRLSPRERTYLYGLANNASGELKQRILERIAAKESDIEGGDVDERAVGEDRRQRDKAGFADALELALEDSFSKPEDVLTLCRERAADAPKVVAADPELAARVLVFTKQSPLVVFPTVGFEILLGKAVLVEPTLAAVPDFVILREAAGNATLAGVLGKGIDTRQQPFLSWLRRLPAASGLSSTELAGLKSIFATVKDDAAAREVFKARFGAPASDGYSRSEVSRLWSVLERLPRSHADQGAVYGYLETKKPVDGEFSPGTRHVVINDSVSGRTGDADRNPVYDRDDAATTQMTKDQVKAAFGLDDKQVDQWVAENRLKLDNGVYTVNAQPQADRLTGTALHEVGHAVDQMLGNSTELVFGLADWKQYGDADFDAWASDLGGWDRVAPEDKKKIREAWTLWSNSTQAGGRPRRELFELVGHDHPAVKSGYAGVGVVDFATDPDRRGDGERPFVRNGRAYLMNGVYQKKYSVPMRTVHSAPSEYSMTAPEEYFAECYMTYYLTYDGKSGEKGKLLAPWIKKWFDDHIDKLGHNPMKSSYG